LSNVPKISEFSGSFSLSSEFYYIFTPDIGSTDAYLPIPNQGQRLAQSDPTQETGYDTG
jgi:hypothetical protein